MGTRWLWGTRWVQGLSGGYEGYEVSMRGMR